MGALCGNGPKEDWIPPDVWRPCGYKEPEYNAVTKRMVKPTGWSLSFDFSHELFEVKRTARGAGNTLELCWTGVIDGIDDDRVEFECLTTKFQIEVADLQGKILDDLSYIQSPTTTIEGCLANYGITQSNIVDIIESYRKEKFIPRQDILLPEFDRDMFHFSVQVQNEDQLEIPHFLNVMIEVVGNNKFEIRPIVKSKLLVMGGEIFSIEY